MLLNQRFAPSCQHSHGIEAVALGLIEANPARQASKPCRDDLLPQAYFAEESFRLLNLLRGQTLELSVALALVFGLQRSEVLGLRWKALDLDRRLRSVRCAVMQKSLHGKSKVHSREVLKRKESYRTLPIPENILPLLRRYQRETVGFVWTRAVPLFVPTS